MRHIQERQRTAAFRFSARKVACDFAGGFAQPFIFTGEAWQVKALAIATALMGLLTLDYIELIHEVLGVSLLPWH